MAKDYVLEEDGLVPESALETELMEELHTSSRGINAIIAMLIGHGEFVRDMKLKQNKLPRSYIRSLGEFLSMWMGADGEYYIRVVNGGDNPSLELHCLDPSIAAAPLLDTFASIHMSGTIGNLRDYRTIIGLPEDTVLLQVPSDFPEENRKIVYVSDLTTKHDVISRDAGMIASLCERIVEICNAVRRNTIVFFPSHALLSSALSLNLTSRIEGEVLIEQKEMSQQELMLQIEKFKRSRGAVFLSVMGGRISEGMDFPDESLEMVIIAGIPYPRPTAKQRALINYYDILYRKGWDYAVRDPAIRRLLQASGRMIRSDRDRGIAIVLDKRLAGFREIRAEEVSDAAKAALEFFSSVNK
jgi:DNA excision repair protein ERCC-2